jgi:hypothetical protein
VTCTSSQATARYPMATWKTLRLRSSDRKVIEPPEPFRW